MGDYTRMITKAKDAFGEFTGLMLGIVLCVLNEIEKENTDKAIIGQIKNDITEDDKILNKKGVD